MNSNAANTQKTDWQVKMAALAAPFPAADIEWRVGRSGMNNGKPWASVLAYVTSRAIMDRLDAVMGPGCWQNKVEPVQLEAKAPKLDDCRTHIGFMCSIGVLCGTEWIWKTDVSDCSDIEPLKGGVSGSIKRAAVLWGVGRYLYGLGNSWAVFTDTGEHSAKIDGTWLKWSPPALPEWALPSGTVRNNGFPEGGEGLGGEGVPTHQPDQEPSGSSPKPPSSTGAGTPGRWEDFVMPGITKKCGGLKMGECADDPELRKSLHWWANNFMVKPGRFAAENQKFRDALDAFMDDAGE